MLGKSRPSAPKLCFPGSWDGLWHGMPMDTPQLNLPWTGYANGWHILHFHTQRTVWSCCLSSPSYSYYDWGGCPQHPTHPHWMVPNVPRFHKLWSMGECLILPSGYVKIAIENDHRNSGFSQRQNGGSFHSYVSHYQRVGERHRASF